MNEQKVYELLAFILKEIREPFLWRLEGSANLLVQGVDVKVNDLDITTNEEGINIFRELFEDNLIVDEYSNKTKGPRLVLDIIGEEVEINCYGDRKKNYFDKIIDHEWNNLHIPILPLKYAKEFYEKIQRKEKVELISSYLQQNQD